MPDVVWWLLLILPALVVAVSLEAIRLGALLEIEREKGSAK